MTITGTDQGASVGPGASVGADTVTPTEAVPTTDIWVVRLVVIGLLAIALTVIVAQAILSIKGADSLPDQLMTLGAVAVGSLGTLLASTRTTRT